MALITRAKFEAQKLLKEIGVEDITDIPMDYLAAGLGATFIEEPLKYCDGRISFSKNRSLIKINSAIEFPERKRFIAAHEIGHHRLHRNMDLPPDTSLTLNIIEGAEKHLKTGRQEVEANQFAGELLMPTQAFLKMVKHKKFSPGLLRVIAEYFKTSLTASAFKFVDAGLHPVCLVMIENGLIKYFKKSEILKGWMGEITRLAPPPQSVATEYINNNYGFLYSDEEKAQSIKKSVWFEVKSWEEDDDYYEYCIPFRRYKTVLSIIWPQ